MRPLILLPSRFTAAADSWRVPATAVGRPYQEAIVRAGGVPLAMPPLVAAADVTDVLARVDGLCLPGGPDVHPARYGAGDVHPATTAALAADDELDLALALAAVARRLPILAVCRGHQVLNVALGGGLHQHLPDVIGPEAASQHMRNMHELSIAPGSRLERAMGTVAPTCHCVHHQSVDELGAGLRVTAWCDGIVEGVERADPDEWVVGVQWHPEDTAAHDRAQQALFDSFVGAARARAAALGGASATSVGANRPGAQ